MNMALSLCPPGWGGGAGGPRPPASPAASYLGLARHAQEEAEGSPQGGADPGVGTPFQMAAAAEGEGRGEKILPGRRWRGRHDNKEKGRGDLRGKTQEKGKEGKGGAQRKDTPHPHLLGRPACAGLVSQAPLFMRELQAPPRYTQTLLLLHPGPIFSLGLLPAEAGWGGALLPGWHFPS